MGHNTYPAAYASIISIEVSLRREGCSLPSKNEPVKIGTRFQDSINKFTSSEEWLREDVEAGMTRKAVTEREIRLAMNSVNPDLKFTTETKADFENSRLTTLSFQLWSDKNGLRFSYFEKSMRSQILTMAASSQSEKSKISILINELNRRLAMMDDEVDEEERIAIVDHFTKQLINSGYSESQIMDFIICSLKGRSRKEEMIRKRGKKFESAAETLSDKTRKKLLEASSWYKDRRKVDDSTENEDCQWSHKPDNMLKALQSSTGNWRKGAEAVRRSKEKLKEIIEVGDSLSGSDEKIQGVIFVQHTQHSKLAQNIREKLRMLETVGSFKIKIAERIGDNLVDILHKSNCWANEDCSREDCLVCKSSEYGAKKGSCRRRNVTYETFCLLCEEEEAPEMPETHLGSDDKDTMAAMDPEKKTGTNSEIKEKVITDKYEKWSTFINDFKALNLPDQNNERYGANESNSPSSGRESILISESDIGNHKNDEEEN